MSGYPTENDARRALLAACRRMNEAGINQGKSGNVSLRWHRGGHDGMLISASGLPYERAGVDDVVWMDLEEAPRAEAAAARTPDGAPGPLPVLGDDALEREPIEREPIEREPSSEWRMHAALHRVRDARAVVHTHSAHATALSCLSRIQRDGLPAFHYMVAVAGGRDIRCARYETFGTRALSDAALAAIDGRRACLLANHGVLAFGDTLDAAFALAQEVETLARMYAIAQSLAPVLGSPALLDDAEMDRVIDRFRTYGG